MELFGLQAAEDRTEISMRSPVTRFAPHTEAIRNVGERSDDRGIGWERLRPIEAAAATERNRSLFGTFIADKIILIVPHPASRG